MRSNHFDSTIFGITILGQGSTNAVEGHRAMLRNGSTLVRRLSLRLEALALASWRALKRMPAWATPAMATCLSYSDTRQTRCQRVGVVTTRGTVGVC